MNYSSTNSQLAIINILNSMYNNNVRQTDLLIESINNLENTNEKIRELLVLLSNGQYERTFRRNLGRDRGVHNRNSRHMGNNGHNAYYYADVVYDFTTPLLTGRNGENRVNNLLETFFQPVEVYPTSSQIEAATRRVRYCDIVNPIHTSCPISMEEFRDNDMVTVLRPCGHIFHTDNIMNWFRTNCRCPVCRTDIREYSSNASSQYTSNNGTGRTTDASNNSMGVNSDNNTRSPLLNSLYDLISEFSDISGNIILPGTNSNSNTNTNANITSTLFNLDNNTASGLLRDLLNRSRNSR